MQGKESQTKHTDCTSPSNLDKPVSPEREADGNNIGRYRSDDRQLGNIFRHELEHGGGAISSAGVGSNGSGKWEAAEAVTTAARGEERDRAGREDDDAAAGRAHERVRPS